MKPSLQLKFSQQLTMTPQLQQAIKLLQLSTLDLQQEIQEALESNPLLEVDENSTQTNEESTPDKLEEAFMGVTSSKPIRAVYNYWKCLELLMLDEDADFDESIDWLDEFIEEDLGKRSHLVYC